MKKDNIILTILLLIIFSLLMISLIIGVVMVILGDISKIALMFGTIGLVGFLILFIGGFLLIRRVPKFEDENNIHEYYISLVNLAESNPKIFNRKYKMLIGLGGKYILLLYIITILSIIGIIALGVSTGNSMGAFGILVSGLLGVLYIVTKALYIRTENIEGYLVNENKYPKIFETINSAKEKSGVPKLQKVYIYDGANCAVCKSPIGFGFRNENILAIGMYLLWFLNQDELESILIHEFAHIYNKDTAISYKINRNIIRWNKILENCERKGIIANALLRKFAENYIMKMQMYSGAVSKQKEILADMESVKYTSKDIYAAATMKLEIIEFYFNKPIEENQIDIRSFNEAPSNFYSLIINEFLKHYEIDGDKWNGQIIKRISNKYDTHPSYKERMEKIGVTDFDFKVDFYVKTSILSEVNEILNMFNNDWYNREKENWDEYRDEYKKTHEIISNFKLSEDNDKNIEYGMALENLIRLDEALAFYSLLIKRQYDNAPALFRTGLILLNRNDGNGIDYIKKAIEINNGFIDEGLNLIGNYLELNGLSDKKEEMREWALQKAEIYSKELDEVNNLYPSDNFVEAELSAEQRQLLKKNLSEIPSVKIALIATKELKFSKENLLVVGIISKQKVFKTFMKGREIQDVDLIVQAIEELETPYFLLDLNESFQFTKPITLVKNSELLRR